MLIALPTASGESLARIKLFFWQILIWLPVCHQCSLRCSGHLIITKSTLYRGFYTKNRGSISFDFATRSLIDLQLHIFIQDYILRLVDFLWEPVCQVEGPLLTN